MFHILWKKGKKESQVVAKQRDDIWTNILPPLSSIIASKQAQPSWLYALKLADNFSSIKKLILLANSAVEWVHREAEEKSFVKMGPNSSWSRSFTLDN